MAEAPKLWLLMVDGAARGNPGEAGCGAVIADENGVVVKELSRYLGRTTNNVAEYEGLLMGLEALLKLGQKHIVVQSDSQLLVRQLNGEYRVRDEKLKVLFAQATRLLRQFARSAKKVATSRITSPEEVARGCFTPCVGRVSPTISAAS